MRFIALSCVVLIAIFTATARADAAWDVTEAFSNTNGNPNDVWSYGWLDGSTFTLYYQPATTPEYATWISSLNGLFDHGAIWQNVSSGTRYGVDPGQVSLQPQANNEAVIIRWTAPEGFNGDINIQGQFLPGDTGNMLVAVVENGNWNSLLWQDNIPDAFNLTDSVMPGDTIDFAVYGGYFYGNTPLDATIIEVPEPSMLGLLVAGLIGLTAYTRTRKGNILDIIRM